MFFLCRFSNVYDGDVHRGPLAVASVRLAHRNEPQVGMLCAKHCGDILETPAPSR